MTCVFTSKRKFNYARNTNIRILNCRKETRISFRVLCCSPLYWISSFISEHMYKMYYKDYVNIYKGIIFDTK